MSLSSMDVDLESLLGDGPPPPPKSVVGAYFKKSVRRSAKKPSSSHSKTSSTKHSRSHHSRGRERHRSVKDARHDSQSHSVPCSPSTSCSESMIDRGFESDSQSLASYDENVPPPEPPRVNGQRCSSHRSGGRTRSKNARKSHSRSGSRRSVPRSTQQVASIGLVSAPETPRRDGDERPNRTNHVRLNSTRTLTDGHGAHAELRLAPLTPNPRAHVVRNSRSVGQSGAVSQTRVTTPSEDLREHVTPSRSQDRADASINIRSQDLVHSATASSQSRLPVEEITRVHLYDSGVRSLLDIENLHLAVNLIDLNLHCNQIQHMENLDNLSSLQNLDLSSNLISRIESLGRLSNLLELNLASNNLRDVFGIHSLHRLTALVLSYNQISDISALNANQFQTMNPKLEVLELHGNQISELAQISHLRGCTKLTKLSFAHGESTNPVCYNSDYANTLRSVLSSVQTVDDTTLDGLRPQRHGTTRPHADVRLLVNARASQAFPHPGNPAPVSTSASMSHASPQINNLEHSHSQSAHVRGEGGFVEAASASTSRIDSVLGSFRKRRAEQQNNGTSAGRLTASNSGRDLGDPNASAFASTPSRGDNDGSHVSRLEAIEKQLALLKRTQKQTEKSKSPGVKKSFTCDQTTQTNASEKLGIVVELSVNEENPQSRSIETSIQD